MGNTPYVGTSQSAVAGATRGSIEYKGAQWGVTQYVPDQFALETNKTYYWRIDEINEKGSTKGDVWSFTTHSKSGI